MQIRSPQPLQLLRCHGPALVPPTARREHSSDEDAAKAYPNFLPPHHTKHLPFGCPWLITLPTIAHLHSHSPWQHLQLLKHLLSKDLTFASVTRLEGMQQCLRYTNYSSYCQLPIVKLHLETFRKTTFKFKTTRTADAKECSLKFGTHCTLTPPTPLLCHYTVGTGSKSPLPFKLRMRSASAKSLTRTSHAASGDERHLHRQHQIHIISATKRLADQSFLKG